MGASFRNVSEIKCLAGCDLLTISPSLLAELSNEKGVSLERVLSPEKANQSTEDNSKVTFDAKSFHAALKADQMADEKLKEGIEKFSAHVIKLENSIKERLAKA